MAKPELTKQLIADAFMELARRTNNINKVTIQKIIETCGVSRNTFYYHFANRAALIIYVFDSGYLPYCSDPERKLPGLRGLTNYLVAEKALYEKLLRDSEEREELKQHIMDVIHAQILSEFTLLQGDVSIPEDEIEMLVVALTSAVYNQNMYYLLRKSTDLHLGSQARWRKFMNLYPDLIQFIVDNYYVKSQLSK